MKHPVEQRMLDDAFFTTAFEVTNKFAALREMAKLMLGREGYTRDQIEIAANSLVERDTTRTTAIGNGLMIPHGKSGVMRELTIGWFLFSQPRKWDALDGKPVVTAFCLLSPANKTGSHIHALARLSRVNTFESFRKKVQGLDRDRPPTPEEYRDDILSEYAAIMARLRQD